MAGWVWCLLYDGKSEIGSSKRDEKEGLEGKIKQPGERRVFIRDMGAVVSEYLIMYFTKESSLDTVNKDS